MLTAWRVRTSQSKKTGKEILIMGRFFDIEELEVVRASHTKSQESKQLGSYTLESTLSASPCFSLSSEVTQGEVEVRLHAEAGHEDTEVGLMQVKHLEKAKEDDENYDDDGLSGPGIENFSTPPMAAPNIGVPLSSLGKHFLENTSSETTSSSSLYPTPKKQRIPGSQGLVASITPRTVPASEVSPRQLQPKTPSFSSAATSYSEGSTASVGSTPSKSSVPFTSSKSGSIWNQLKPCPLGDLHKRSHGSKVDILAVIHSIDDTTITRNTSVKRDCRLVDPSSPPINPAIPYVRRPTILSVWVKPQSFYPPPGTLMAFRGLTVHRYDGRSLNAFSDVAGSVWYVENPDIDRAEEVTEWWEDICLQQVAADMEKKNGQVEKATNGANKRGVRFESVQY
ncbi:hypothetical protein BDZ91DRAFT_708717 [Kalaharituber pfeilii]|nr:hypothetical protein BDZ91DRAFT_708717 [Kalaharituber pfeilii]